MKKREMIKKILALSVAAAMTVSLWVPVYAKKSETVPEISELPN